MARIFKPLFNEDLLQPGHPARPPGPSGRHIPAQAAGLGTAPAPTTALKGRQIDSQGADILLVEKNPIDSSADTRRKEKEFLDWLRIEHGIETPGRKLEDFSALDFDEFATEVKKRKPKDQRRLSPAALSELKQYFQEYATHLRQNHTKATEHEHRLSDLVNQAYSLTQEEIQLMWKTAPPRMPV